MNSTDMKNFGMALVYAGAVIVIGAIVVALVYHQWSDCLEENSVLTCMRMLGK